MRSNPTKDQIQAFLSGTVVNYDLPPPDATEGWCAYRSPAPYGDEYQGYNNPICVGPFIGFVLPPTPTYDEFVKWGSAKANYLLLSNQGYLSRAQSLGVAMGIAIPLGAVIGGYATYAAATSVVANTTRLAAVMTSVSRVYQASTLSAAIGSLAIAGVALVTTLIAAIATAIIVGINVANAASLPEKLATLVDTANSTTPDAATLVSSTDSTNSLLSLFIAVTTPTPSLYTCDNPIFLAPGMYEITLINSDPVQLTDSTPCLNTTTIPATVAADPQFIVTAKDTGAQTLSPTISVKDAASSTVTTARLSKTWFVTQSNGLTAQTLRLAYTDWSGKQQNAWLIGNATDGYSFLTFAPPADASTTVDASTCVADGSCGVGASIKYIGADDQQYSATVRPYQAPTDTPIVSSAVEASPVTLNANGFAPGSAVQPVTYQWAFKSSFCNFLSCTTVATATGATYTWQTGGTYQVDLTATDAIGDRCDRRTGDYHPAGAGQLCAAHPDVRPRLRGEPERAVQYLERE